jgi:hypothetical protein
MPFPPPARARARTPGSAAPVRAPATRTGRWWRSDLEWRAPRRHGRRVSIGLDGTDSTERGGAQAGAPCVGAVPLLPSVLEVTLAAVVCSVSSRAGDLFVVLGRVRHEGEAGPAGPPRRMAARH